MTAVGPTDDVPVALHDLGHDGGASLIGPLEAPPARIAAAAPYLTGPAR